MIEKLSMGKVAMRSLNILQINIDNGLIDDPMVVAEYASMKDQIREIVGGIEALSIKEMLYLGFSRWDENQPLYLIPLWFYDLIPDGIELTSIFGDKVIKGSGKVNLDIRFGLIAWGLTRDEEL